MNTRSWMDKGLIVTTSLVSLFSAITVFAAPNSSASLAPFGSALLSAGAGAGAAADSVDRLGAAVKALQRLPGLAGLLKDGAHSVILSRRISAPEMETTKFQAYYQGLEVVGAAVLHHRLPTGAQQVEDLLPRFDLETRPSLSAAEAVALARAGEKTADLTAAAAPELKILPIGESGAARLIYSVPLASDTLDADEAAEVLVDAHSGERIAEIPAVLTVARIQVYSAAKTPQIVNPATGSPTWADMDKLEQVVRNGLLTSSADAAAIRAKNNAQRVIDYYRNVHKRDSYDNEGSDAVSVVHWGKGLSNAAWNPSAAKMFYGDGDGKELGDFTRALDVAGHEFTHAVTSTSVASGSTRGFVYMGESGALDEATADIFGKRVANDGSWVLGRELFLNPDGLEIGIRDLATPGNLTTSYRDPSTGKVSERPYPATFAERFPSRGTCDASNDRCWVHVNSTIWSHAAYLMVRSLGWAKVEKLYYATLTHKLTPTSTFKRAKEATVSMCASLYDTATCSKVKTAFAQVGL